MNESMPIAPQAATHAMSACGTYVYRCRNSCYTNCTGGAECTGEKLPLAVLPPPAVSSDGQTPVPAAWSALVTPMTSTTISESYLIIEKVFLLLFIFRGGGYHWFS